MDNEEEMVVEEDQVANVVEELVEVDKQQKKLASMGMDLIGEKRGRRLV